MLRVDLVLPNLRILKNLNKFENAVHMLLGSVLSVEAGLKDRNDIYHMKITSSDEDTVVLKVQLELILTAALDL